MSIPEQFGDSFDFCVLFRVYFTGKGAPEQSGDSFDFCMLFRVYFTGKGALCTLAWCSLRITIFMIHHSGGLRKV